MIHLLHFEEEETQLEGLLLPWLDSQKSWRSAAYFQRKFSRAGASSGPAAVRRRQSAGAWALLEQVLLQERGLKLADLEIGETSHRKPVCLSDPGLCFSLSHCEGLVACVVADGPVGVDCESPRAFLRGVAERVCSPAELEEILAAADSEEAFCRHWTLKESLAKAVGTGLSLSLRRAAFFLADDTIRLELERPLRPEEEALLRCWPHPAFALHRFSPGYWVAGCALVGGSEAVQPASRVLDGIVLWTLKDLAKGLRHGPPPYRGIF